MAAPRRKSPLPQALMLVAFAILLSVYTRNNKAVMGLGSWALAGLSYPLQWSYQSISERTAGFWQDYIALMHVREENIALRTELAQFRKQKVNLAEVRVRNRKLRVLLKVKNQDNLSGQGAKIIGYDPTNYFDVITIDRGSVDGVVIGQPVIAAEGLVGQILFAGTTSSQVLLITDRRSSVDALAQRSRVRGVVDGVGTFSSRWNYILNDQDVKPDDKIVSSGLDQVYPQGILIGAVVEAKRARHGGLFQEVKIKPAVDFSKLEYVFVLNKK